MTDRAQLPPRLAEPALTPVVEQERLRHRVDDGTAVQQEGIGQQTGVGAAGEAGDQRRLADPARSGEDDDVTVEINRGGVDRMQVARALENPEAGIVQKVVEQRGETPAPQPLEMAAPQATRQPVTVR